MGGGQPQSHDPASERRGRRTRRRGKPPPRPTSQPKEAPFTLSGLQGSRSPPPHPALRSPRGTEQGLGSRGFPPAAAPPHPTLLGEGWRRGGGDRPFFLAFVSFLPSPGVPQCQAVGASLPPLALSGGAPPSHAPPRRGWGRWRRSGWRTSTPRRKTRASAWACSSSSRASSRSSSWASAGSTRPCRTCKARRPTARCSRSSRSSGSSSSARSRAAPTARAPPCTPASRSMSTTPNPTPGRCSTRTSTSSWPTPSVPISLLVKEKMRRTRTLLHIGRSIGRMKLVLSPSHVTLINISDQTTSFYAAHTMSRSSCTASCGQW